MKSKDRLKLFALSLSILILCSCESVVIREPIGENPVRLEAAEWDGKWVNERGEPGLLKVLEGEEGIIEATSLKVTEDGSKAGASRYYLRESGDWMFASYREDDTATGDKEQMYFWARVKRGTDSIIAWLPDYKKFKALVEAGTLPGEVDSEHSYGGAVMLGDLKPEHYQAIVSGEHSVLFDWENPIVLFRVEE